MNQLLVLTVCLISTNLYSQSSSPFTKYAEDTFSLGIDMVAIKGGQFEMGSKKGRAGEKPVHKVTVDSFHISETEITQAQFLLFLNNSDVDPFGYVGDTLVVDVNTRENPLAYHLSDSSFFFEKTDAVKSENCPVNYVSYRGAILFCDWLSKVSGKKYRLPTEAEWECAARGEANNYRYSGSDSLDLVGWHSLNSDGSLHIAGGKMPNSFGLFDMSGNVSELCLDTDGANTYKKNITNPLGIRGGNIRCRGGSWYDDSEDCTVSDRSSIGRFWRSSLVGFRIVCVGDQETVFQYRSAEGNYVSEKTKKGYDLRKYFSPLIQYDFGSMQTLSLGVGRMKMYHPGILPLHCHGLYADVGMSFRDRSPILVNKVGYEYYLMTLLAARVNVVNYTDFSRNQIAIRPEIGFSILTLVTVACGYTINTTQNDYFNVTGNVVSLRVEFPLMQSEYRPNAKP